MLIFAALLFSLALLGGVLLFRSGILQEQAKTVQSVPEESGNKGKKEKPDAEEKTRQFVTDVDPDVNHWQTKETEFFTIKFPKEWYWMESNREKTGYYSQVITNNPDFDIDGNAEIGLFSGIGPISSLELSRDTEVVITDRGSPTSNAGTPQDSLDSIFSLAKKNNPSVNCKTFNNRTVPFTAYCSVTYENRQLQQSYYIINEQLSLTITAHTTQDTLVKKGILDKIVKSVVLKSYL